MPGLHTEEPVWVQRMRTAGYNVRVGTLDEPMSEVPDAMFSPPIHPLRRLLGTITLGLRTMFRPGSSTRDGWDASLP